jgi:hypothetical protein
MERQLFSAVWLVMYFCGHAAEPQVMFNRNRKFKVGEKRRDDMLGTDVDLVPLMHVLKTRASFPCIAFRTHDNSRVTLQDVLFLPKWVEPGDGISNVQRWFLYDGDSMPQLLLDNFQRKVNFVLQGEQQFYRHQAHALGTGPAAGNEDYFGLNSPVPSPVHRASTDEDDEEEGQVSPILGSSKRCPDDHLVVSVQAKRVKL